jgi:NarL family two-component system sensor histidine kinase LiaS
MRGRVWGISARLIASYVLVTLAAVVLVEALVMGSQAPRIGNADQRQDQARATDYMYASADRLSRFDGIVPVAKLLGVADHTRVDPHRGPRPAAPVTGPAGNPQTVSPEDATAAVSPEDMTAAYGVAVKAPPPPGFINPIRGWSELHQWTDGGPLLFSSYLLLLTIIPAGVLFGLLASRRLVGRVHRLEAAAQAVACGDYTVALPMVSRDEVGRLEANFTAMARHVGSTLAAERDRATGDAQARERARIAREVHDALSQHLFGLRMIAGGMRRASPDNEQAEAIERITEAALRDMRALLLELRPASLNGDGLAPALREICATYRDRLGVTIDDDDLHDVTIPEPAGHALLRITQEACVNAVRHGHAARLAVSLAQRDGQVELAVRDDGAGFDVAGPSAGAGLVHIRDRAAEVGGTVTIDSAPGAGTAVTVRVPAP